MTTRTTQCYSVILAARLSDPYLPEAINSVFGQSLPPEEVIVVGSADESSFTKKSVALEEEFPGIRVAACELPGMIPALNLGLEIARSEFVAFLDSDDLWCVEKQARQASLLAANPDLDAVYSAAANFHVDELGVRHLSQQQPARLFTCTTFRRSVFDALGGPEESATHHSWLYRWWATAQVKGIRTHYCDYLATLRRLHADNSWRTANAVAKHALFAELRRMNTGEKS
jgi:glycosyltransferase involved in cell wall biosynthesis